MRIAIALVLSGCMGIDASGELSVQPATLEVDAELGVPRRVSFKVFAGNTEVTADATYSLVGAPLGGVDATGFATFATRGGRASIVITHDGETTRLPVRVVLRGRRYNGAPADAPQWFREGTETIIDAALEPGDGAVIPPNLGRLDVHFAADDFEDVHELAVTSSDLDIRVYSVGAPGARTIELTPAEWRAIAETSLGSDVDLAVRSLRVISRKTIRTARATLRIAELPFAREIMFTGRTGTELPQMWTYDVVAAKTAAWMPDLPAGSCLGCHVAISKDGNRIAAGGSNGSVGGGVILDRTSRSFTAPYNAANTWIAASFDPSGSLLSTTQGQLTWRDGLTATPIKDIATDVPASQPTVSNDGRLLAYVGGPIDAATTNPITQELRIHDWSAATGQIGTGRVLVAPVPGETLKLPEFSPDDQWVLYSRVRAGAVTVMARPSDGRFIPLELVPGADFARFASPIETVHAGTAAAEPMTWIVMKRYTAIGVRSQDKVGQLWAAAFFPERGVVSRPFHLSGQRADVAVLHAPLAIQ